MLEWIALVLALGRSETHFDVGHFQIPVLFAFRELDDLSFDMSIAEVLRTAIERRGGNVDAALLQSALIKGRLIVLVDGLDQIGDEARRRHILEWLIDQISRCSRLNRLIISCRDAEWNAEPTSIFFRIGIQSITTSHARDYVGRLEQLSTT